MGTVTTAATPEERARLRQGYGGKVKSSCSV